MSSWVIVDGQGRVGTAWIQRTISVLSGLMTEQQCVEFLIVNCGFAALRRQHRKVDVRFRPSMLCEGAFAGVVYQLHELERVRAVACMFIDGEWRHEILPLDREAAIDRIEKIVAEQQLRPNDKVLRQLRPLRTIPVGTPMGWVFQLWQHCSQRAPSRELQRSLAQELGGRYVWIDALGSGRELIMAEVGGGFPAPVCATLNPGLGSRIEDQPDPAFGRYCADAYGGVAVSGDPTLEDVDAIMTPPDGPPVRRRYSRLILPFRSSTGHTRLLGVSFENLDIDLRRRAS